MNWYAILGRLSIWIASVGGATFALLGQPEPVWWAGALAISAPIIQALLAIFGPKNTA